MSIEQMISVELSWTIIIVLIISPILGLYAMGLFNWKNHFPVENKTILLTGASMGMGLSVAKQLSRKGANIIIASRNIEPMKTALKEIQAAAKNPTAQKFHYISADLSKSTESTRILTEAKAWNNGASPDIVWCIAGSSYPHLFLETSSERLRQQMDINYWATADMSHAVLGDWLKPETAKSDNVRHLILTSSSLAFYTIAGYGTYSPAKAAIRSLCDVLRQEILLYSNTVKIHTVFPGGIDTPGFANENLSKAGITKILEKDDPVQQPDDVASKAIAGLERGETFIVVNFLAAAMRACSWGGTPRNNWLLDTLLTWLTSIAWIFISSDLDGKCKTYGKVHGHPSTYPENK